MAHDGSSVFLMVTVVGDNIVDLLTMSDVLVAINVNDTPVVACTVMVLSPGQGCFTNQ